MRNVFTLLYQAIFFLFCANESMFLFFFFLQTQTYYFVYHTILTFVYVITYSTSAHIRLLGQLNWDNMMPINLLARLKSGQTSVAIQYYLTKPPQQNRVPKIDKNVFFITSLTLILFFKMAPTTIAEDRLTSGHRLSHPPPGDEVLITGVSGYFPDSDSVIHLQENLFNKVSSTFSSLFIKLITRCSCSYYVGRESIAFLPFFFVTSQIDKNIEICSMSLNSRRCRPFYYVTSNSINATLKESFFNIRQDK